MSFVNEVKMRNFYFIFIIFSYSLSHASVCHSVFKPSDQKKSSLIQNLDFLINEVKVFEFTSMDKPLSKEEIILGLNQLKEDINIPRDNLKKQSHLKAMELHLNSALAKLPEIINFMKETPQNSSKDMNKYTNLIFQSVLVTFSKHVPAYLDTQFSDKDWGRINLILRLISQFDPSKGHFSLYKIKRAIEGRYSIREYILCK